MSNFKRFGLMLDCSRNAVMKPEAVKDYMRMIQKMGYNCLMLYTEETYEIKNNPYFGYLRGRYSIEEMKDLVAFGDEIGVELIPCIQTLAHVNAMVRWPVYWDIVDCNDILLAGAEKTYQLIEDMFSTIAETFTSRVINIGMDEAHMVGLGKYLDQHGYENRFQIIKKHLERVADIAKKYGFECVMWSDMFFRLKNHGGYYVKDPSIIDDEVVSLVPENVSLCYWDYYTRVKEGYDTMIEAHERFGKPVWFGGGLWDWLGATPLNGYSISNTKLAVASCLEHNVENVFFTVWGDNGGECSFYAILPSLYYAAQLANGITDEAEIKASFEKEFGIAFDDFMLIDLTDTKTHSVGPETNPERYMLYNDYFLGIYDSTVNYENKCTYGDMAKRLAPLCSDKRFGQLFRTQKALCEVLDLKYDIGVRTRTLYRAKDKAGLEALIKDYYTIHDRLEVFTKELRNQWFDDNKPHGFDVQEIRLGGLMLRTKSCAERLEAFVKGEIDSIPELDEDILDCDGAGTEHSKKATCVCFYAKNVTVNPL